MKFLLITSLFILSVFVAIFVYKIFKIRYQFFKDIVYIINQIRNNVTYNKNSIDTILADISPNINKNTMSILKNQSLLLSNIITSKEKSTIKQLFDSFGRGDITYEIGNLNYHKNNIEILEKKAKESFDKNAIMYFKLIIGLGLIICIILA